MTAHVRATREVRALGAAALAWVSAHREGFALGDDALAEHGNVNTTWKPLGELAQVCVCVRRHTAPADPLHVLASDLLSFAWQQTERGALFVELQRLEPFATYPLEIYAAFASAGLRHAGYESATATVARTRGWHLTEQEPNRRMSVLNSERRSGLAEHEDMPLALRRTWLAGLPEPWTFELAAGYTLTHVIFHLTDWGLTPRPYPARRGLPPALARALARHLSGGRAVGPELRTAGRGEQSARPAGPRPVPGCLGETLGGSERLGRRPGGGRPGQPYDGTRLHRLLPLDTDDGLRRRADRQPAA